MLKNLSVKTLTEIKFLLTTCVFTYNSVKLQVEPDRCYLYSSVALIRVLAVDHDAKSDIYQNWKLFENVNKTYER